MPTFIYGTGGGAVDATEITLSANAMTGNHNNSGAYSAVIDSGPNKLLCVYMLGSHNYSTSGSSFKGITRIEGSDNGSSWATVRSCESTGSNGHNALTGTTRAYRYYRLYGGSNGGDVTDCFAFACCINPTSVE